MELDFLLHDGILRTHFFQYQRACPLNFMGSMEIQDWYECGSVELLAKFNNI